MAKGLDKHRERLETLALFGKDLTRRAGSKCELCETSNVKLQIHEVPPVPAEPDFEHCIFICDACQDDIDKLGHKSCQGSQPRSLALFEYQRLVRNPCGASDGRIPFEAFGGYGLGV